MVCASKPSAEKRKIDLLLVEDAHDNAFPVQDGARGNPQVNLASRHDDLDAAILRHPALCNIELGKDLDAGGNASLHLRGQALDLGHDAIDAVAHAHSIDGRLNVNVGGALLDGVPHQSVDEPDHRHFARHVPQALHIIVADEGSGGVSIHLLDPGVRLIKPFHGEREALRRDQARRDWSLDEIGYGCEGVGIEGIGHGTR